mmetsp:Transcript_128725/g.321185  ORF Transcript_128725/g.321185 Transcript_128725/m.321185 type:complete len:234 (+) Transcript_128725:353-1054(+)
MLKGKLRSHVAVSRARHRRDKPWLPQQGSCERHLVSTGTMGQSLADHGAGIAIRTHRVRMLFKNAGELLAMVGWAVLQEVLHHVVPVRVPAEGHGVDDELVEEALDLGGRAVLDEALHDAAAVAVARGLRGAAEAPRGAAGDELVDDELGGLRLHCRDALLDDVVRMWAPHCLPDVAPELEGQGGALLVVVRDLERPLHVAAALGVAREAPDLPCKAGRVAFSLLRCPLCMGR